MSTEFRDRLTGEPAHVVEVVEAFEREHGPLTTDEFVALLDEARRMAGESR